MDEKKRKPTGKGLGSKKLAEREKGNLRERERSFINQRMAVLRPHDEPGGVASTRPSAGREDAASQQDTALPPAGLERQKLIAQYRRRQQKREDAPEASACEERPEHHASSLGPGGPQDDDDEPH